MSGTVAGARAMGEVPARIWAFIIEHAWAFFLPLVIAIVGGVLDAVFQLAHEIGRLLPYGAYVGVGVLGAAWLGMLWLDLPSAIGWHLVGGAAQKHGVGRFVSLYNRQVARLQAAASLATLTFIAWRVPFPLASFGVFVWIVWFGTNVLDALLLRRVSRDDLSWARRLAFHGVTLVTTIFVVAATPGQFWAIGRFLIVVWIGLALRIGYWVRGLLDPEYRFNQPARLRDDMLLGILLVGMALPLLPLLHVAVDVRATDTAQRTSGVMRCGWAGDGPKDPPDVSLFIVSDSQFHTIHGERTQGHTELVDRIVPVAVRPIELDLLSFAPLLGFARTYAALKKDRPRIKWAHLGDYGDLGCDLEIERFRPYALAFGSSLAALSPGNHDSTYIGNFDWHPDWDKVCGRIGQSESGKRIDKVAADAKLLDIARPLVSPDETSVALVDHPVNSWTKVRKDALVWVSRLGESGGREVIGAFLDSSDYTSFALGAAGVQGGVSEAQASWVIAERALHPRALVVLFMHHPLDEISNMGRVSVERIAASLGGRLLAVVSAHTHLAAYRFHRLAGRAVPEFVVGSTIDPPQEAALLEIGPSAEGVYAVRVRTVPSVTREGLSCNAAAANQPTGATCDARVKAVREASACKPMFERVPEHDTDPRTLRIHQAERSQALLACVCRDGRCQLPLGTDYLEDDVVYPLLEKLANDPDTAVELTCLAWVASVLQGHKAEAGMSLAKAAEIAFESASPTVDFQTPAVLTASGIALDVADAPPPGT